MGKQAHRPPSVNRRPRQTRRRRGVAACRFTHREQEMGVALHHRRQATGDGVRRLPGREPSMPETWPPSIESRRRRGVIPSRPGKPKRRKPSPCVGARLPGPNPGRARINFPENIALQWFGRCSAGVSPRLQARRLCYGILRALPSLS